MYSTHDWRLHFTTCGWLTSFSCSVLYYMLHMVRQWLTTYPISHVRMCRRWGSKQRVLGEEMCLCAFQQLGQQITVTACRKWCMLDRLGSRCWSSFNVDAYKPHYTSAQVGSSIARRSLMRWQKPLSCQHNTFHTSCGHVWVWCDLLCKVTFHLVTLCSGFDRSVSHLPYLQTVLSCKTVVSMVARLQTKQYEGCVTRKLYHC